MQLNSSVATRPAARGFILGAGWVVALVITAGCGQKGPLTLPAAAKPAASASAAASGPQASPSASAPVR